MNLPAPVLRYAKAGWRHRWLGLAVAWLVCLAGWVVVYRLPDQYTVSARVFAAPDLILGEALRGLAVDGQPQQQVEVLQRTLLARPNLERVVARTGLDLRARSQAERENLINALSRQIRILLQTRQLFRLEYTDQDPRVAHAVIRTVVELFLERAANNDRQQMANARSFINQQIAAYETQLREAEQRRAEFRTRFLDLLPQAENGGASRLEQARARLAGLRGQLEDQTVRRDLVRRQFEATPATIATEFVGGGGGGGGGAPSRVQIAEAELRELRLRYTDQHPAVIAQRQIVSEMRALGAAADGPRAGGQAAAPRPGPRPNPQRESLQARLLEAEGDIASLERQIRAETAEVQRLEALARSVPQVQAQFANLDRDYGILRRQYEELLERRESLQVAGAARAGADQVRIEVVEPPVIPVQPVGPNRRLLAAGVLVVGLGAGGFLAVVLALLDRSFHTLRDLRSIGLPVLGAISALRQPSQLAPNALFGGLAVALLAVFLGVLARGEQLMAKGGALLARFLA